MNIHSPAFIKFAMVEAERWLEIIIDWLAMSAHMHIVYYENLILDWETEIRKILQFLVLDENNLRIKCTKYLNFASKRRKLRLKINPYNRRLTEKINIVMEKANSSLVAYGYSPLPTYLNRYN